MGSKFNLSRLNHVAAWKRSARTLSEWLTKWILTPRRKSGENLELKNSGSDAGRAAIFCLYIYAMASLVLDNPNRIVEIDCEAVV
jgi:hypothetical protein